MERIASFTVDHDKLLPGMYLSRKDGDVATYDLRFVKPNTLLFWRFPPSIPSSIFSLPMRAIPR